VRQRVNTDTGKLINDFQFPEQIPDNRLEVKRGDSREIDWQFGRAFVTSTELGTPTIIKFGCKVVGDYDGPYVVSNYDEDAEDFLFLKTGTGEDLVYRTSPSWYTRKLNNLLGHDPAGFEEETLIRCAADVSSSLDGKYFVLYDRTGSVGVWIDVGNTGTAAPAGATACARAIEITTITAGMAAGDVATAIATALNADAEFVAEASGSQVTVEDAVVGPRTAATAGTSGCVVTRWITGSLPNTLTNVDYVDLVGELEWSEDGAVSSTLNFTVRVHSDVNQGNEGVPKEANPAYPAPGNIVTGTGIAFVTAPASKTDMTVLPGSVAPASGKTYLAIGGTGIWSIRNPETEWRFTDRASI
jgi:hypothetical protein